MDKESIDYHPNLDTHKWGVVLLTGFVKVIDTKYWLTRLWKCKVCGVEVLTEELLSKDGKIITPKYRADGSRINGDIYRISYKSKNVNMMYIPADGKFQGSKGPHPLNGDAEYPPVITCSAQMMKKALG